MKKTFAPLYAAISLAQAEAEVRREAASAEAWEGRVRSLLAGHGDDAVLGEDLYEAVEQAALAAADAAPWVAFAAKAAARFGGDAGAVREYARRATEAADRAYDLLVAANYRRRQAAALAAAGLPEGAPDEPVRGFNLRTGAWSAPLAGLFHTCDGAQPGPSYWVDPAARRLVEVIDRDHLGVHLADGRSVRMVDYFEGRVFYAPLEPEHITYHVMCSGPEGDVWVASSQEASYRAIFDFSRGAYASREEAAAEAAALIEKLDERAAAFDRRY